MAKNSVVEILYTDACPFWRETLKLINEILKEQDIPVTVKKTKIASEEEARRCKFPGSPTVRINGVDIDPGVKDVKGYIGCRVYFYEGRVYDSPPRGMLESAVKRLIMM